MYTFLDGVIVFFQRQRPFEARHKFSTMRVHACNRSGGWFAMKISKGMFEGFGVSYGHVNSFEYQPINKLLLN